MKEALNAYDAQLRQCNKEALIAVGALVSTVVVWAVCGFGLAGVPVKIAGVPLWVIGGTLGTWVFAVLVAAVLSKKFFRDFDVEEGEDE